MNDFMKSSAVRDAARAERIQSGRKNQMARRTGSFSFQLSRTRAAVWVKVCRATLWMTTAWTLLAGNGAGAAESPSADQALQWLVEGNQRYMTNGSTHPNLTSERRAELVKGQNPFAIILCCSDSRVAPELVFDQGLGDLFILRNAGNVLDDHTLGSIEYAVEHLHVNLIVVVGHAKCGAVSAAVAAGEVPGHIRSVVESIAPAVEQAKQLPGDAVDNTVRLNAQRMAEILAHVEPIIKPAVMSGQLKIAPARYDLETGRVEFLKANVQTVSK